MLTDQVPGYKGRARSVDPEVAGHSGWMPGGDALDGLVFPWMVFAELIG